MRILVLGGTQFVGRHVVERALLRGHEVTLFNRGQTRAELFADVEKLRGDRDGDLAALAGRTFDAVVDTSGYVPRIVRETIEALGEVGHYTFVSSISVYAEISTPPVVGSPVAELEVESEEWREHYGALKADCEDVVRERFPNAFIPRPGLIVGPWDPTGRFTYWPVRIAEGGRVLAPAPADAPAQVIDARDLAAWIVLAAEQALSGTFNAVGSVLTRLELLNACVATSGSHAELVWIEPEVLLAHGIEPWSELPLWLPDPETAGMLAIDPAPARAAGLELRRLADTISDTLTWALSGDAPDETPAGLDRAKEREVLES